MGTLTKTKRSKLRRPIEICSRTEPLLSSGVDRILSTAGARNDLELHMPGEIREDIMRLGPDGRLGGTIGPAPLSIDRLGKIWINFGLRSPTLPRMRMRPRGLCQGAVAYRPARPRYRARQLVLFPGSACKMAKDGAIRTEIAAVRRRGSAAKSFWLSL